MSRQHTTSSTYKGAAGGPSSAAENPTASFTFPWVCKQSVGADLHFDLLVSVEQLTKTTFAIIDIRVIGIGENSFGLTPDQYRRAARQLPKKRDFRERVAVALAVRSKI